MVKFIIDDILFWIYVVVLLFLKLEFFIECSLTWLNFFIFYESFVRGGVLLCWFGGCVYDGEDEFVEIDMFIIVCVWLSVNFVLVVD